MTTKPTYRSFALLLSTLLTLSIYSCRTDERIVPSTPTEVTDGTSVGSIEGLFLLNEGNMGSNKATIDYFDYKTGIYTKNIYAERNPGVVKELGDVGNDLAIYGNKLYAVINCSNFVEVMDVETARHITQISIPNCRYIAFKGRYAYVSSYAGPVKIDPNARLGYVAKIDTVSMQVVDTCVVGYQPDGLAVVGNKLYVANSGGYRVPDYDRTVSVIDLGTFRQTKKIDVAINLHRIEVDRNGLIYVSSRGDYYNTPSMTCVIDSATDEVVEKLSLLPNSEMTICGDSLYVCATEWSYLTNSNTVSYAIYDVGRHRTATHNFITDGTDKQITIPYGIAVNPETRELFVTDAKDYVTPGTLYCFSPDGKMKWSVTTGDIPAHIAFTRRRLKNIE